MYYKNGVYRSDIILTGIRAEKSNNSRFNLVSEKKTYFFKAQSNEDAEDWVKKINKAI